MTKAELAESVASKVDLPRAVAEQVVNVVFNDIVAALEAGEKVNISGFGTFAVVTRRSRTGRNPKTGESIEIAEAKAAKFKPGKVLRDSINQQGAVTGG